MVTPRCTHELGSARGELKNDSIDEQQPSHGATAAHEEDCSIQGDTGLFSHEQIGRGLGLGMLHVVEAGSGWPQARRCGDEQMRTSAIRTGRSSCLATLDDAPGSDWYGLWLGCARGSTSTSLVVEIGGASNWRGRMREVSGREKRKEKVGKRKEREKGYGFFFSLGFSGFLTRIYTLPKFLERKFIFAYF